MIWRKARTLISVLYAYMVEYRAELVLWALASSLPFILMGAWMKAGATGTFPLGPEAFARYFLCAFLVRQMSIVWVIWEFEYDVVKGRLTPYLLQPIDPVWRHLASHVAERFARLPFSFALVVLFFALYPAAAFVPELSGFLLGIVFVVAAFLLRFVIQYTFAMVAFWTERASGIETLWNLLYLFLSGMIAPLVVFPEAVRDVALWLPFPYLVYTPVSLILGWDVDVERAALVMLAWGAAFLVLNRTLWRLGLRQYASMGA